MKKAPRRKRRRGWMSGLRGSARGPKTTLAQWIVVTPFIVLVFAGIVFYVYVSYFSPDLARGEHTVTTDVLERVESTRPDGSLDPARSYLLVRVEGRDLKLRPVLPQWSSIAKGDRLVIQVGRSTSDGSPIAYSYTREMR